jgi:hypothetical protein
MGTETTNAQGKTITPAPLDLCCKDCGEIVKGSSNQIQSRVCPACGGQLVLARLIRNRPPR